MNRYITAAGLALALGCIVAAPQAAQSADGSLNGRWAYFMAKKAADTDRGPRNDAGCRAFLASDLYDGSGEILTITPTRFDDNQDVSAVTGDVKMGKAKGNVIPFTLRVESEAGDGSGDGVTPATGTITRLGSIAITVTVKSAEGRRVLHYCKVS